MNLFDWLTDSSVNAPTQGLLPEHAFRYMGADGLDATVNSKRLRMNAWSNMNDPREAKQWEPPGTLIAVPPYSDAQLDQRLDDVLRRSARLLSLIVDRDQTVDAEPRSLFHRGWAKAPMWAHYADSHQGVCLVLDLPAVLQALDDYPVNVARYRNWGRINYADRPIRLDITGSFATEAELDHELYSFLEHRYEMSNLHMEKNTDWSYEAELRLAVVDRDLEASALDTPINLPLGDCIAAVIFGDGYPNPAGAAEKIGSALGSSAPEFFQCRWTAGTPQLSRV